MGIELYGSHATDQRVVNVAVCLLVDYTAGMKNVIDGNNDGVVK